MQNYSFDVFIFCGLDSYKKINHVTNQKKKLHKFFKFIDMEISNWLKGFEQGNATVSYAEKDMSQRRCSVNVRGKV